jgi:hypothetical protein
MVAPSRNPDGRPKGSPNKFTKDIKQACLDAFAEGGGKDWLKRQMKTEPRAFMALLGKILPTEIKAEVVMETKTVVIDFTGLPALEDTPPLEIPIVIDQVMIDPMLEVGSDAA